MPAPYALSTEQRMRVRRRRWNDSFPYPPRCICDGLAPHVRLCPRYILPLTATWQIGMVQELPKPE
jgi:hypothetical protein